MMGRIAISAGIAATLLQGDPAASQERTFACQDADGDAKVVAQRAANFGILQLLEIYRDRYDAAFIRAQCEAFASGEPYDIACLDGRRDWDAIEASIPDDYFGMSVMSLAPFIKSERDKGTGHTEALDFCRSVGAIK